MLKEAMKEPGRKKKDNRWGFFVPT
jgi:hypothetical protein